MIRGQEVRADLWDSAISAIAGASFATDKRDAMYTVKRSAVSGMSLVAVFASQTRDLLDNSDVRKRGRLLDILVVQINLDITNIRWAFLLPRFY